MAKKASFLKLNWKLILLGGIITACVAAAYFFFNQSTAAKKNGSAANSPILPEPQKPATPSAQATQSAQPAMTPAISGPGIPILMYHYVGYNPNPQTDRQRDILSITPEKLDAQLAWLAQTGHTPITLDTLYAIFAKKTSVPKPVVLTFDDGYVDFFINAFPILRKYGFHAVAFIPTGLMSQGYYLSWSQIRELQQSGLISFEAHTVHHYNLPSLPYNQMLDELRTSKQVLEAQTGATVNFIAYPYGASNGLVWKAAQEAGFIGGVGTWYGHATGPGIDMPRIRINGGISLTEFAAKVGG